MAGAGGRTPDLILHGGRLFDGSASDRLSAGGGHVGAPPTALAVRDGWITAIGCDELIASAGPGTEVLDVGGRTVMPGVNDGHLHLGASAAMAEPFSLDLTPAAAPSLAALVDKVVGAARRLPPGTWISGHGWRASALSDVAAGRLPDSGLLDRLVPEHPVVLADFSGHCVLVNAKARERVAPTNDFTPVDGPLGIYLESDQAPFWNAVPPPTAQEAEAALRSTLQAMHRLGITSVTDAAIDPFNQVGGFEAGAQTFDTLRRICGPHDLPMRVACLMAFSPAGATALDPTLTGLQAFDSGEYELTGAGPEWFTVRGLKIFADGIPPNQTALMRRPYPNGSCGCLTVSGDNEDDQLHQMRLMMEAANSRGLQIGVHVTGDRGAHEVVDVLAGVLSAGQSSARQSSAEQSLTNPLRHYLIHATLASPDTLAIAGRLGLGVNVQPALKAGAGPALDALIGPELGAYQWPLRTMLDSGCVMAASSDSPVTPPDWRAGVVTAVTRRGQDGEVSGPDQRVSPAEVLSAYTRAGAWQDGNDDVKGRLAPGRLADLCVVDARPYDDPVESFGGAAVTLTMVGGRIVHRQGL